MAGHGHQRPLQAPGHVLDEARLAAAGGAFQHHRQAALRGSLEHGELVAGGVVVGLAGEAHERSGQGADIGPAGWLVSIHGLFFFASLACLASSAMRFFNSRSRESTCDCS